MPLAAKRLSLGIGLIVAASALLLVSDRRGGDGTQMPRIAILQQTSTPVLDDGVRGMLDGLAERGYRNGETAVIKTYNAEGDMAIANAIGREITDGSYDLVMTSSTPSLQVVANANKAGRVVHVFGLVADPYVAGVGLDPADPLVHPRHLVGYGIMLPVIDAFEIARRMLPGLARVGVAWNPAEANSRMFVGKAREACQRLGIDLIEANVENSAGVTEAVHSIIGRGAQAIWVGGDNTVSSALDSILASARQAHIPVFSILPSSPDRGTIFDVGMDFYEAGRHTALLAGDILHGADPAAIPIRDLSQLVPRHFLINQKGMKDLRDPWKAPSDLLDQAEIVVDDQGVHRKTGVAKTAKSH